MGACGYAGGLIDSSAPEMIVQCNKCQTKFRLPDKRMKPDGVKVRCSRCGHVFKVKSTEATDSAPPPMPELPRFGAAGGPSSVLAPPASPPPAFPRGDAPADSPLDAPPPFPDLPMPAPPGAAPDPAPQSPAIVLLPLAQRTGGNAPASPPGSPPAHDATLMDPNAAAWRAHKAQAAATNEGPTLFMKPDAPAPEGALPPPFPQVGGGAPSPQLPAPSGRSSAFPDLGATPFGAPEGLAQGPSGEDVPPPFPSIGAPELPGQQPGGLPPVDALFSPGGMIPSLDELPSPEDLGIGPPSFGGPPDHAAGATGSPAPADPFGDPFAVLDGAEAAPEVSSPALAVPTPSELGFDGSFLDSEAPPPQPAQAPQMEIGPIAGGDFGGLDVPIAGPGIDPGEDTPSALGRIELVKARADADGFPMRREVAVGQARAAQALADRAFQAPEPGSILRGVAVLVLVAGLAFGALWFKTDGDLSKVDGALLADIIGQGSAGPSAAALGAVRAEQTSAVIYPVGDGEILIVRGTAANTGSTPLAGVQAHVRILDGRDVVAEQQAWLGVTVSDLRLATMRQPAEVDVVLVEAMRDKRGVGRSSVIGAGETLDFMVLFAEVPESVTRRAVQVEFRQAEGVAHAGAAESED